VAEFPFGGRPGAGRSAILGICQDERERQWRKLIMIPSESICHPEAAAIVACELGSIYAEGLPQPILSHDAREAAADEARFWSWQARLADRRYYKGTLHANRAELVAQRLIALAFARLEGSPAAADIHVNPQPLSGAAANLAVYEALLRPGDVLMGMDLSHGGHLTHGSKFNFSGKTYRVHSYCVDERTRRLDYARIRQAARESRPRLIIGGASSYPWDFDWAELRSIADEVGAYLLADVAHLAGMIVAGLLNNPLPYAHVVTFTTHKTLCGPRGAVIVTAEPELGQKLDSAVFPGLQGGPHMNSIAAIGRLFELILEDADGFRRFQRAILDNTGLFGQSMAEQGFALEYGGTNTHMLLVDLKKLPVEGDRPLDGEIAARLLEIAGIVCNKNVLPGDADAAQASGLRFGLPWLTQRGVNAEHLRTIAGLCKRVLSNVRTFGVWSPLGGQRCRGRVPPGVLEEGTAAAEAIVRDLPYPPRPAGAKGAAAAATVEGRLPLLLRGDKVRLALSQMLTARMPVDGTPVRARMLDGDGEEIDDVVAAEVGREGREEVWLLLPHADRAARVRRWIEGLSDGYLMFDPADLHAKVDGPTVVEEAAPDRLAEAITTAVKACQGLPVTDLTKPYFIGQKALYRAAPLPAKPEHRYEPVEPPLRRTVLNAIHRELGAKMAPFAGWEMPIHYPAGILAEHRAVRTAAGLFDVSHMAALEVSGPHALPFLEVALANCVSRLDPGEAQYSGILDPDGVAMDDVFVYRLERDRFMLVANAANAERVKDWLSAVNARRWLIDRAMPARAADGPVEIRDLREAGEDSRVGFALQGPASLKVLQALCDTDADRLALGRLAHNAHREAMLARIPTRVARTGYTGEDVGYELYVHPDAAPRLWGEVLGCGRTAGVLPAGLGARDSTRIEAGFPLFGHELEGHLDISMEEAGYGYVERLHVPFFIGRGPSIERGAAGERHILRLRGQGRRTVRAGHLILDATSRPVGRVTSFAYVHQDMTFVVLACVEAGFQPEPGAVVRGVRVTPDQLSGEPDERSIVELTVMTRFPEDEERDAWPARYV
jgi:glycine hydroxymethyltransferase